MADFFFFTDVESIVNQDNGDNFGPFSDTEYKVDSFIKVEVNSKAYAICDSQILVQFNSDNSLNIILRPTSQPDFNIGNISFIIYKGIDPNSLIDGVNVAERSKNDLTEYIWKNQQITDTDTKTGPNSPLVKLLGINYKSDGQGDFAVADTELIENIFHLKSDFQLPYVKAGDHIGNFIGGSKKLGIQIITEKIGFNPTFQLARKWNHSIIVDDLIGTTQSQSFLHYHKKEQILGFIDFVSFFGNFSNSVNILNIRSNTNNNVSIADLIEKFINKNRLYLDIRNENNHSYNYYQLFGSQIGISNLDSFNFNNIPCFNYYTQNISEQTNFGLWPIFIVENISPSILSTNSNHAILYLKIPDEKNVLKSIYFMEARKNGEKRENSFEYNLSQNLIDISSWIYEKQSSKKFGAANIILKLHFDKTKSIEGLFVPGRNILDHIFPINQLTISLSRSERDVTIQSYQNGTIIENIDYPDFHGDLYAAFIGIAKDTNSYTFFVCANNEIGFLRSPSLKPNFSFVTANHKDRDDFFATLWELSKSIDFEINEIQIESTSYPTIRFINNAVDIIENSISESLFDAIQISQSEYSDLITLMNTSGFILDYPIYVGTNEDDEWSMEYDDYHFRQVKLTLEGLEYVPNTNNEQLQKKIVSTNIALSTLINK